MHSDSVESRDLHREFPFKGIMIVISLALLLLIYCFRSKIFAFFTTLLVLIISGPFLEPTFEELSRVTSPDGKFDAVLLRKNEGAAGTVKDSVFFVPAGEKSDRYFRYRGKNCALMLEHMSDPKLFWLRNNCLMVQYTSAASTYYIRNSIKYKGEEIEIRTNMKTGTDSLINIPET